MMLRKPSPPAGRPLPLEDGRLLCGVASPPGEFGRWRDTFGGRLQVRMLFQAWARAQEPETVLSAPGIPMISWEPWDPVPAGGSGADQGAPQPVYSNRTIADGHHDDYVDRWAGAIADYAAPVLLRPMHEFNGNWYPWSHDPAAFTDAWRHLRTRFDRAGADNVIWVWSYQPGACEGLSAWRDRVSHYWPGEEYVDVLGMSMVRFLTGANSVGSYMRYLQAANRRFRRPTMITEANVAHSLSREWLPELERALEDASSTNLGFVWSQLPSREQARNPRAGEMEWDARSEPAAAAVLRSIAQIRVR